MPTDKIGDHMKALKFIAVSLMVIGLYQNAKSIEYVGSTLFAGIPNDVCVSGNYAYVAGEQSVYILSTEDTVTFDLVGGIALPGKSRKLIVDGQYIYVADDNRGLQIIDAADPSTPILAAAVPTDGASAVAVSANYAYVANLDGEMNVVDIADPYHPIAAGAYYNSQASFADIIVDGNYAYLVDTLSHLFIIDISDPHNPIFAGGISTYCNANSVVVRDTIAYVTCNEGSSPMNRTSFDIFNVANPVSPSLISSYQTAFVCFVDIFLDGNYAFLASPGEGSSICYFDITDPANPILHWNSWYQCIFAYTIYINDNHLFFVGVNYFSGPGMGTFRIDITDPSQPRLLGGYRAPDFIRDVFIINGIAYVSSMAGLYLVDISNPSHPTINRNFPNIISSETVVRDNYAYMANNGLSIYDISSIDTIPLVGQILTYYSRSLELSGNYAYLTNGNHGICVVDISDPTSPDSVGRYTYGGVAYDVAISGNYAYCAFYSTNGFRILNIENPADPVLVGSYSGTSTPRAVAIRDNYAYVADNNNRLLVLDISNPSSPSRAGLANVDGKPIDIVLSENYAYLSCDTAGIFVFDISNPSDPLFVDRYRTNAAQTIEVDGHYLYVADKYSFQILHFDPTSISDGEDKLPSDYSLYQNYPNPFNSSTTIRYNLPENEKAILSIYDITGRQIKQLAISGGRHEIVWDGLNANGSLVASGVYFYAIHGHGQTARRMVLLR